jgi:hypothetical protein
MVPHGGANCTARFLFPSYWRLGNLNSLYPSAARVLQIACHPTVTVDPLHAALQFAPPCGTITAESSFAIACLGLGLCLLPRATTDMV